LISADDCTISDNTLNALLCQVVPGREEETLKEIDKKIGKEVIVYKGFGRYDFLLLYEGSSIDRPDFSLLENFHEKGLTHVKEWVPIVALKWKVKHKKSCQLSNDKKLIGFSCIKLDPDFMIANKVYPVDVETSLVKDIRSKIRCHLYSNLGFNELIVIVQAQSLRELTRKFITIRKSLIRNGFPVAIDMCTIPGVNYRLWIKNKILFGDKEKIQGGYLFLSLRIGLNNAFKAKLDDLLETKGIEKSSVFGFHDKVLPISDSLDHVMDTTNKIRDEGPKYGLHSTFTIIPHYDELLNFKLLPVAEEATYPAEVKGETSTEMRNPQLDFYKAVHQAMRRDPITRHLFRDTKPFFLDAEKLWRDGAKLKTLDIGRYALKRARFDGVLDCLRVGFNQRCSGIYWGNLLSQRTAVAEPLGGLQRVIMAMESLPIYLLSFLGFGQWNGFCIYGHSNRFYRAECGVINVPTRYRRFPEMWWNLFHETGHDAFHKIDNVMKTMIMREINKIRSRAENVSEIVLDEIYHFIEEIFAELFSFHFGFRDDWDLYTRRYWSYFSKEYEIDWQHLSRSVLLYFTFGPGESLMKDQITIDRIWKCVRKIEEIIKRSSSQEIDKVDRQRIIPVFWTFLDVADVIRTYFTSKPAIYTNTDMKQLNNTLKKGIIVRHDNPMEILHSFIAKKAKHKCRHRFAVIMSLFNTYFGMVSWDNNHKLGGQGSQCQT
jgi:hypothetical protein